MLYSVKAVVLLTVAHAAAPLVASAFVFEATRRTVKHFSGEDVPIPDVSADMRALAEEHSVDEELLSVVCNAATCEVRSIELAVSLKRQSNQWLRTHRKGWNEAAIFDQTARAVRIAMVYCAVEDSWSNMWGSRTGFGNIWRATKLAGGDLGRSGLGRLRQLPPE